MTKLEADRANRAHLDASKLQNEDAKFAKQHLASQWGREPLIPFHMVQWDPMHGLHNEFNALINEPVHEHLKIESPDKEVEAIVESVKNRVNVMWKEKQLPKFIQFGRDGKGENSHALNGPTVKAVLRDPNLIIDTIEAMAPVYALMEQGRYQLGQKVEKVKVRTEGSGASVGDAPVTKKQGGGRPRTVIKPKPKKKNERGMGFGNIVSDDSDEEGHVGQGGAHETCHAGPPSNG
ncbi:hypothetical protein AB1Y20_004400 [Prymnesium parvum]|uniref:Uncharacterized protein n=1 Tax=Prymnesium parvum TaxID=97485 RepID=A0AB34IW49_PRYPA